MNNQKELDAAIVTADTCYYLATELGLTAALESDIYRDAIELIEQQSEGN